MRNFSIIALLTMTAGCAGVTVQPGHRALYFDPSNGGIQHEVLQPGWYRTACPMWTPENKCPRVDDFDVTFSTAKLDLHTNSGERLPLDVHLAIKYRPIVSELYLLDTEIGPNYFDEVVGPEFNSAATGVFAHTSYADLQLKIGAIEDEIEAELKKRLHGQHVEVSSVLIEKVTYAPEILQAQKERVVSQERTLRQKQDLENEALRKKTELETQAATRKLELETEAAQKKMELEAEAEQHKLAATTQLEVSKIQIQKETEAEKFRIDQTLRNKQAERRLTIEQAQIDRMKADSEAATHVARAKGEAQARLALAKATAEETRASVANVTPMHVMMHAYDALGHLGGSGTTVMLGDWSKVPQFLFPRMPQFQSLVGPWYTLPPPVIPPTMPAPARAQVSKNDDSSSNNPY
jgi:regulator of protease activity HflC (stomatin/prohibitin superfamily)